MASLDGQVAVITGGASGIGEATARLFVAEGASVLIADLQDERAAALVAELGETATYLHTNVALEADVEAAVGEAVRRFGRLD